MPRSRVRCLTVLMVLLALTTGCASTTRNGVEKKTVIATDSLAALNYRYGWRQDLSPTGRDEIAYINILDDLLVTVYHPSNTLVALNMDDGSLAWTAVVGRTSERAFAPVQHDNILYVATETRLYELNINSGRTLTHHSLDGVASTSPTILGDSIIFGGVNGLVWAQRVDSGASRWRFRMSGRIDVSPLVVQGDRVLVGDHAGNVTMFSSDGNTLWTQRARRALAATPAAPGVAVFAPCNDSTLYAWSASNGSERWLPFRADVPLTDAPLADGRTIYLSIPHQDLVALDTTDGQELWTLGFPARPLTFLDRNVLATDNEMLYVIAADSGDVLHTLPTSGLEQVLISADHRIVLLTPEGRVMVLAPRP